MHVIAPEGVSTCTRYMIVSQPAVAQKGQYSDMKVIEDFESRPHKVVTFIVERGKERQEWNEQKLPKALPGHSRDMHGGRRRKKQTRAREK